MDVVRKLAPIRFEGEVKDTCVTINTNVPLDDPSAIIRCVGDETGCAVRLTKTVGCEIQLLLPELIAELGEGYYEVVIYEGCDECDTIPVVIDGDCYITKVETKTNQTTRKDCVKC